MTTEKQQIDADGEIVYRGGKPMTQEQAMSFQEDVREAFRETVRLRGLLTTAEAERDAAKRALVPFSEAYARYKSMGTEYPSGHLTMMDFKAARDILYPPTPGAGT